MKKILCMLLLLIPFHANAYLIERDYISLGDNLILYDTDTGLEWLDHTVTRGISADAILNGHGGFLNQGFLWANIDRIKTLTNHAGFTVISAGRADNVDGFQEEIISFLEIYNDGEIIRNGRHSPQYHHRTATDYTSCRDEFSNCELRNPFFLGGGGVIYAEIGNSGGGRYLGYGEQVDDRFHAGKWGSHYLARWSTSEVPEPSSIALLGLGLAALSFTRRKKS